MDFVSILLFWVLLLAAVLSRGPYIFYLLFGSMSFGSFAVIPPALTQGLSFTPPPIIAMVIIFIYAGGRNGLSRMLSIALRPSQCLLLTLFWIVAIWVTLFMPRIFAGMVTIIPMRLEEATNGVPLYPTPQNMSQILYLSISVMTVFTCALAFRGQNIRQHVLGALCLGGAMVVVTGLLDLAGLGPYLDMFRTATYVYLTDVEIANVKRVVGLMPEASAFGSLAVAFLTAIYFLRRAISRPFLRLIVAPCLIVLLALFALLSTSSAAYGGLAVFGCVAAAEWFWRLLMTEKGSRAREGLVLEFWAIVSGLAAVYLLALFNPAVFNPFLQLIDTIIFQKTSSDSFEERSMWTAVSLKALIDTWGLGVGMGGTRASNGLVAVFSNTGLVGGLLYYGFLTQTYLRRAARGDEEARVILTAVRFYMPPVLIMGILAGTSADFGVMNACIYALSAAIAADRPAHAESRPVTRHRQPVGVRRTA
ncbi:hypothetical protein ASE36_19890 [Rhizobium sp. Root274]|uniref:hypothetical protein n=1 Tax=unclassified Rhizobium TaxID=2613769 RepID=UPI000714C8BB|nr:MULTISPECIES: hypothetical protein [unclassified Rhizobium]KQW27208.1 hypothetical protein ASC71_19380 [Rhizobium sp. Root1240]KRD26686.1 hypothetical protein ASE36_19890 [Rhizobium sp. Root274]